MKKRDIIKRLESLSGHEKKKKEIRKYIENIYEETGYGSVRIHNELQDKFSSVSQDNPLRKYLVDRSTIERWIHPPLDVEKMKVDKPHLYPYLALLQEVHNTVSTKEPYFDNKPLPNLFVTHAERCLYRFNDPLGQEVDLYAQYVVIREYCRRDTKGDKNTKDLDFMLDNRTWFDDDENLENTPYYKAIEKEPKLKPYIAFIYHKRRRELEYRIYDFLGISFILSQKTRYKHFRGLKRKSISHELLSDYRVRQDEAKGINTEQELEYGETRPYYDQDNEQY